MSYEGRVHGIITKVETYVQPVVITRVPVYTQAPQWALICPEL